MRRLREDRGDDEVQGSVDQRRTLRRENNDASQLLPPVYFDITSASVLLVAGDYGPAVRAGPTVRCDVSFGNQVQDASARKRSEAHKGERER